MHQSQERSLLLFSITVLFILFETLATNDVHCSNAPTFQQLFFPNAQSTCKAISKTRITWVPRQYDFKSVDVCLKDPPIKAWLTPRSTTYFVQPDQCDAFNKTSSLFDDDEDVTSKVVTDPIATFDEWTQQQLAQRNTIAAPNDEINELNKNSASEKQVSSAATNKNIESATDRQLSLKPDEATPNIVEDAAQTVALQSRRNYASKECGAKIVNKNNEAEHANAILNEKERDEYLRNPCHVEGKFIIIELCESVQPLLLELANFELFSSSPSEIRVAVSERYPTSEWSILTTLSLENTRHIQKFEIKQRLYIKFLRLELLNHHGSEHFCTLSLVRLLGISMVDEYEAHEMAVRKLHQQLPVEQLSQHMTEDFPSDVSSDLPVNKLEDDKSNTTQSLRQPKRASGKNSMVDIVHHLKDAVNTAKNVFNRAANMVGLGHANVPPQTIHQIYEACAIKNQANNLGCIPVNATHANLSRVSWNTNIQKLDKCFQCPVKMLEMRNTKRFCDFIFGGSNDLRRNNRVYYKTHFLNGRTQRNDHLRIAKTVSHKKSLRRILLEEFHKEHPQRPIPAPKVIHIPPSQVKSTLALPVTSTSPQKIADAPIRQPFEDDDTILLPASNQGSKESIFIRLTNRIKQLELNMSLSSMYLSELSKKYRSHMDDIQRQYNRTVRHLNETNRRLTEINTQLEERLQSLQQQFEKQQISIDDLKAAQDFDSLEELYLYIIGASLMQLLITLTLVRLLCHSKSLSRTDVEKIYHQLHEGIQSNTVIASVEQIDQSLNNELGFKIDQLNEPRDDDVEDDRPSLKSCNTIDECSSTESSMQMKQVITLSSRSIPTAVHDDDHLLLSSLELRTLDKTPHKSGVSTSPPWIQASKKFKRSHHKIYKNNGQKRSFDCNRFSALSDSIGLVSEL